VKDCTILIPETGSFGLQWTPRKIINRIHNAGQGFYLVKFHKDNVIVNHLEPADLLNLCRIDYDLLVTGGPFCLLRIDKTFSTCLLREIYGAARTFTSEDINWDLRKKNGKYILDAVVHGDEANHQVFSKELPAPHTEFPAIGFCSSGDPKEGKFVACLASEE